MDVSKSKSSASNTANKTSKLSASHTATKTAITIATKVATMADGPFILDQKRYDCDPKSNVRKSARQKLSMVESDIDVSKIKLSASNTATKTTITIATKVATMADGPFILDQKKKRRRHYCRGSRCCERSIHVEEEKENCHQSKTQRSSTQ